MRRRPLFLAGVAALLLAGVLMAGQASEFGFWQSVGLATGTRDDARPVDFSVLTRRSSPNDALVCPRDVCPGARADSEPPVFALPVQRLREKLRAAALTEPRTVELSADPQSNRLRFAQRSALLRYPDIIDVLIVPRGGANATLALYSRSLVGRKDFDVNRARIERWLAAISQ